VRETGIKTFGDKGNRSASPHSLGISKGGMKGSRNRNMKTNYINQITHPDEYNNCKSNILAKNSTFDYLQSKSLTKSNLNQTQNKTNLELK